MTEHTETGLDSFEGSYLIRLEQFEGPLDLLLHLIKKNEINIYDIPMALITKQYLEHINLMKSLNLVVAGEFLVLAATLIHIKSKMLLPSEPDGEEEEGQDPRAELLPCNLRDPSLLSGLRKSGFSHNRRREPDDFSHRIHHHSEKMIAVTK